MKYCPKNKSHKNPKEAIFCSECGTKLVEKADYKTCSYCNQLNPVEATFCKDCGKRLPDENGCIDFKVNSSVVYERILAVDTKQVKTNTDCAIFKLKANSKVDILFECKYVFKITVDTSKATSLNVKWGYIYLLNEDSCNIKLTGTNMNIPIIKEDTKNYRISVPYGVYNITFNIDGEIEKVHVDLHSESVTVKTKLHKKYTLAILSEIELDNIIIDNVQRPNVSGNKCLFILPKGKHNVHIQVRDNCHHYGTCKKDIKLEKDSTINIEWCKLTIDTNAPCAEIDDGNFCSKHINENNTSCTFYRYVESGNPCRLTFHLQHGGTYNMNIKPKSSTFHVERKWRDIHVEFDRSNLNGEPCFNNVDGLESLKGKSTIEGVLELKQVSIRKKGIKIPATKRVILEDVPYINSCSSYCEIDFGTIHPDYEVGHECFRVSGGTPIIKCQIPIEKTKLAKWKRLRYFVFYGTCILNIILGLALLIFMLFGAIEDIKASENILSIDNICCILFILPILSHLYISGCCYLENARRIPVFRESHLYIWRCCYGDFDTKEFLDYLRLATLIYLGVYLAIPIIKICGKFLKNEWVLNDACVYIAKHYNIESLMMDKFLLWQVLLFGLFCLSWLITRFLFKMKIKGYSIIQTI